MTTDHSPVQVLPAVAAALRDNKPVVALESTVYSTLGLPEPHNREVLASSSAAIVKAGGTPAMTVVLDGVARVGVDDPEPIFSCTEKVAARDLARAVAEGWPSGVTTVGASLTLAHHAGIDVFATGGIGGVHRGAATSGDISGDLPVIGSLPLVTVCAGAKSFLDLPRTFEMLETLGVAVLGWQTDRLPAFTTTDSGIDAPARVDNADQVAHILRARRAFGQGGVLVCVPPPQPLDADELDRATTVAEAAADRAGVIGPARTPFVLAAIAQETNGLSVAANTALVENNAHVAADIAGSLARLAT